MAEPINYATSADQRALGQFNLSIATSLAIESAVGVHPDLPPPSSMPIRRYNQLWVNLRTLHRNLMGALPKGVSEQITATEMAVLISEEMETIPDMLKQYGGTLSGGVVYYFSNLKDLNRKYPHAALREDNTVKQKLFTQGLEDFMRLMLKHKRDQFELYDDALKGNTFGKSAIITHLAYDLLSAKNFSDLTLLESHTGKFKPQALWHSKYFQGRDLSMIPFTEELLQVFGDTETFQPMDVNLRKAIVELATRRSWSSVTTRARIVAGIDELKNPAHILKLKQLYNVLI